MESFAARKRARTPARTLSGWQNPRYTRWRTDALRQGGVGLDQESIACHGVVARGVYVRHVREPHPEARVGHRVQDAIQRVLAQQIALVGAIALAVGHQFQLVLAGERRVVELLGAEIETDGRKPAHLQPENAARPQLYGDTSGVGGGRIAQRCGMLLALRATVMKQRAEIALQLQC